MLDHSLPFFAFAITQHCMMGLVWFIKEMSALIHFLPRSTY